MNTEPITHAFEIDVCRLKRSMPMVAVGQTLNTLIAGDVLRVNACGNSAVELLSDYCTDTGHTLLQHVQADDHITLYIRKNL